MSRARKGRFRLLNTSLSPSDTAIKISWTPHNLSSLKTLSQKAALSVSPSHKHKMSLVPSSRPQNNMHGFGYDLIAGITILDANGVKELHGMHRIKGTILHCVTDNMLSSVTSKMREAFTSYRTVRKGNLGYPMSTCRERTTPQSDRQNHRNV